MLRILLAVLMLTTPAFAEQETDKSVEAFKKESAPLQNVVEEVVNSALPGFSGVLEHAKATYIDGYGVVVSLEVTLEPGYSPFSTPKTPGELKSLTAKRRKEIEENLERLLKDRVAKLQCLGDSDALTIAMHLFNAHPVDLPNLPTQIQLTLKKQAPDHVIRREF
jgi:hypothetical protein